MAVAIQTETDIKKKLQNLIYEEITKASIFAFIAH